MLALLILIPLVIYFLFRISTRPVFHKLPYQYSINTAGDTSYHVLPAFHFTNADGQPVTRDSLMGKVVIVSFFCNSDSNLTRILHHNLRKVYRNAENVPYIRIMSVTTAPDQDSLPVLRAYQQRLEALPNKWMFVRGAREDVVAMGHDAFRMKDFGGKFRDMQPFTASSIALVDKEGRVRKYYDGSSMYDVEKILSEDLWTLLALEYRADFQKLKTPGK